MASVCEFTCRLTAESVTVQHNHSISDTEKNSQVSYVVNLRDEEDGWADLS